MSSQVTRGGTICLTLSHGHQEPSGSPGLEGNEDVWLKNQGHVPHSIFVRFLKRRHLQVIVAQDPSILALFLSCWRAIMIPHLNAKQRKQWNLSSQQPAKEM